MHNKNMENTKKLPNVITENANFNLSFNEKNEVINKSNILLNKISKNKEFSFSIKEISSNNFKSYLNNELVHENYKLSLYIISVLIHENENLKLVIIDATLLCLDINDIYNYFLPLRSLLIGPNRKLVLSIRTNCPTKIINTLYTMDANTKLGSKTIFLNGKTDYSIFLKKLPEYILYDFNFYLESLKYNFF